MKAKRRHETIRKRCVPKFFFYPFTKNTPGNYSIVFRADLILFEFKKI